MHGYTIHCKDRDACGGGVLIGIEDSVSTSPLSSPTDLEVITVMIPSHSVQSMYLRNSGVDYHAILPCLHCTISENSYHSG